MDEIGFIWRIRNRYTFDEIYEMLLDFVKEYIAEYGNCLVPAKYETADGIKLGCIVRNIRNGCRLTTEEERKKLDEIGFVWKLRTRNPKS